MADLSDAATFASELEPVRVRRDRTRRPMTRSAATGRRARRQSPPPAPEAAKCADASRQPTTSEEDEHAPETRPDKRVRFAAPPPLTSGALPVPRADDTLRVLPSRFEQFARDSAREFAAANKPPWAPNVAPSTLRKVRDWHVLEVYDYAHLRAMDWFAFLELVSGAAVGGDIGVFIDNQARSQSARDVAPSRVGESRFAAAGGGGADFGALGELGTAGLASPAVQLDGTPTLFAPDAPVAQPYGSFLPRDDGPGRAERSERADVSERLAAQWAQSPIGTASETGRASQFDRPTDERVESVIARAVAEAAASTGEPLAQSGGRFRPTRRELDALHTPPWFDEGQSDEAREARRQARLTAQRALPWITRSLATGVFYLNPAYVWALAEAHAWTQSLGGAGLRNVPRAEFMRRRPPTRDGKTASATVRTLFAQLVAEAYAERRDRQGRGVRFQHDAQRIAQAANGVLAQLRRFYYYDTTRRVFVDRRDERTAAAGYTPLFTIATRPHTARY